MWDDIQASTINEDVPNTPAITEPPRKRFKITSEEEENEMGASIRNAGIY